MENALWCAVCAVVCKSTLPSLQSSDASSVPLPIVIRNHAHTSKKLSLVANKRSAAKTTAIVHSVQRVRIAADELHQAKLIFKQEAPRGAGNKVHTFSIGNRRPPSTRNAAKLAGGVSPGVIKQKLRLYRHNFELAACKCP
jgi:hypothetical protein